VTLYHSVDPEVIQEIGATLAANVDQVLAKGELQGRFYLNEVEKRLHPKVPHLKVKLARGNAAVAIVEEAARGGYDLIAMTTHGRSGIDRWSFGSVADKVLHATSIPVLLVRPSKDRDESGLDAVTLRRLVVPLDGSPLAEASIPYALELAQRLDLEVNLVQVVRYPLVTEFDVQVQELVRETAEAYLVEQEGLVKARGARASHQLLQGSPGAEISDAARAEPGTVIVMSSHGRSGLGRWLLGSIAEKVVRSSVAPVLIIRPAVDAKSN
jgi:nucleotide-binding universal stress UspA family protein